MSVMRFLVWSDMDDAARSALMRRGIDEIFADTLRSSVAEIIEDVRLNGDDALVRATKRWDGVTLEPRQLRVGDDEFEAARSKISAGMHDAIDDMIDHVKRFNLEQLHHLGPWSFESEPGLVVGEKLSPVSSTGLFCPSGKASYPSVAAQLATPAVVAGVTEIAVVVPPVPGGGGGVDPAVLVVCERLGIRDVFRANGPAGIAALGFGTATVPRVRMIVGPGSPAVTCTQVEMQRYGVVTMMVLGPTESLVIADEHADPALLAADLLIEAEHGTDSTVVLVTTSSALRNSTEIELERQLEALPTIRADAARSSLGKNGGCVMVDDLETAVAVANRFAPEHLQVAVDIVHEEAVVDGIRNAGEILIGQHTPFSAANFVIGCPASLPTSGFAHVSSGITASAFLKRTAVARADERALRRMSSSIVTLADHEGFPAHAAALRRRTEQTPS
jgi:histidinol dehydrogenase